MAIYEIERNKTRRERYKQKRDSALTFPISLCAINFMHDGNLGFLVRAAACFGAQCVHVIGALPTPNVLKAFSGSTNELIKIHQHNSPMGFLAFARKNNYKIISAELVESAKSINSYNFNFDRHMCLVVGNEHSGVPVEILKNSEKVYIPMPGPGFCLNTSQTANIILYEAVKQFENNSNN